jgi:hypothetical protein
MLAGQKCDVADVVGGFQEITEAFARGIQAERVPGAGQHVEFAAEFRGEGRPVSLEAEANVVALSSIDDRAVDCAGEVFDGAERAADRAAGLRTAPKESSWLP